MAGGVPLLCGVGLDQPRQRPSLPHVHDSFLKGGRAVRLRSRPCANKRSQPARVSAIAAPPAPTTSNGAAPPDFKAWENVAPRVKLRDDIKTIMLFGAGPIVIGQAREACVNSQRRLKP